MIHQTRRLHINKPGQAWDIREEPLAAAGTMAGTATDVSGNYFERIAGNFWFVFFAYFLAISAWSAVSGNDFISSRWRTVAETRKRGKQHLLVVSFPMAYMSVYIYFQAMSGDYKELCAALVAFGFAILHMLRTVMGLWQLHVFKQWTARSICSLQSLGYGIQLSCSKRAVNQGEFSIAGPDQRRERALKDADAIIVNDTIVDNRLSEGDVQCYVHFLTPKQNKEIADANSFIQRVALRIFYGTKSAICLVGIVWPLLFSKSPLYSNSDSAPCLEPREPEEVWLRWAAVLISCAFPNWVTDMRKASSSEARNRQVEYEVYRDRFREKIILSAALHCGRGSTNTKCRSFLPFHHWEKFPKLRSGIFCKQEFLKYACSTGNGLPFQTPNRDAKSEKEKDVMYGYSKFESKLQRACNALPANEGEMVRSFGIEELEWLSIFLCIEDWSTNADEEDNQEIEIKDESQEMDGTDIAIKNLCSQLGCLDNLKGLSKRLLAPLLRAKIRAVLWGNANISELSGHIDNWIALLAGEQVSYMVQEIPSKEEELLFKDVEGKLKTQDEAVVFESVRQDAMLLEKQRLMFQLSVVDPEFAYFDQTLTFLGCSMENLRSSMAKWVERNPVEQTEAWNPMFDSPAVSNNAMTCRTFEFHASRDFESCLLDISSVSSWSQRYLKMRLLWELQNTLQNRMPAEGISPKETEAMMLCILSFPAICVDATGIDGTIESLDTAELNRNYCCIKVNDEKHSSFRIENCKLIVRASFCPQKVHIEVFFSRLINESRIAVTAKLCGADLQGENSFSWESWRNAFHGSLEGTRQWQEEHQLANSPLLGCNQSIGVGIGEIDTKKSGIGPKMKLWNGWLPHRETIAKYEIMTDGLILQRERAGVVSASACISHKKRSALIECPRVEYIAVRYEEATGRARTHASLIAHEFLRQVAGSSKRTISCVTKVPGKAIDEVKTTVDGSIEEDGDLRLLQFEISATKDDDMFALGNAIDVLISGNPERESIKRAVELLERYFTSEATKAASAQVTASLYKSFQNENWVQDLKAQYELMLKGTGFDPIVAISYAGFCAAISSFRKEVLNESGIRGLIIAMISRTFSGNIMQTFELIRSLEMLLETEDEELFSLAYSMYANIIDYTTSILNTVSNNAESLTGEVGSSSGILAYSTDEVSEIKKRKADAQLRLGYLAQFGTNGVDADASYAVELYTQAMEDGSNMAATYNLARLLEDGADGYNGVSPDLSRAMTLYTRAMEGGIDAAINSLAVLYHLGKGVPRNLSRAVELYTRAIEERGSISAMHNLALLLAEGDEGLPANPPRAVELFSRAVEEGGDIDSMQQLAYLLQIGAEGVPKDVSRAVILYERVVAERGDVEAMFNLACLYQSFTDALPGNLRRAMELYIRAIDKGDNTYAMYNLAQMYENGTGIPVDVPRAIELYQRAIDKNGDIDALISLAGLLEKGTYGVPADPIRASELYTRAIDEYSSADAMYRLGFLLENGLDGLPSDMDRAVDLYNRAVLEEDHDEAAQRLEEITLVRKSSNSSKAGPKPDPTHQQEQEEFRILKYSQ